MAGVFLVGADKMSLVKMKQADYLSEKELQELIATHPALLGSCTSENEDEERKLLLIKREMRVPDQENGGGRWSMDHFYLDQAGIPTLVEVKRSKNSQIRREIVGQLLDYAANGAAYWQLADIKERFGREWGARAQDELDAFLVGTEFGEPEFWQAVQANLKRGNIRLVFVADELPPELRRVIEFLNEQMTDVEVLGVELRQFKTENEQQRAIAPSIIGRTSQAEITKGRGSTLTFEDLDEVVAEFRRITNNQPPVSNHKKHYRQIQLAVDLEKGIHYEFQKTGKRGIVCEFHVEVSHRPALAEAMEVLGGRNVAGRPIEFLRRGSSGALRLTPTDQNPAAVAQIMRSFIEETHGELARAARVSAD